MLEIFTIGGGDYVVNTLNAVAAWCGGGGFRSMIQVTMVMGLAYVLLVVAFSLNWRVWFNWFLSATLMYTCLIVPTTSVKVTDRINPGLAPAVVSHVPIGLAAMASFSSQIGDWLTRTAETVFVMPSSLALSSNGIIYGARLYDKTRVFEFHDPRYRSNVEEYFKQCLFYDVLLGFVSMDTIANSNDILADMGSGSPARGMKWINGDAAGGGTEIKTCQEANQRLKAEAGGQADRELTRLAPSFFPNMSAEAAKTKLRADLPVVTQAFHGTGMSADQVFKQKSLVNAFLEARANLGEADGDTFAMLRADTQARNTYSSIAQQAMTWVPLLNIVLTVVFYAMFPVVFPLFLLPQTGVPTLKGYTTGFFYLAAWGPLYAVLHMFIMDRTAHAMAAAAPHGITLAGIAGIDAVNADTATIAGFLMMSVPFLAAGLARGAMAMAGNATSMLAPAQSAAEAAAAERTTGNYSYGNLSYQNLTANTVQRDQWGSGSGWGQGGPAFGGGGGGALAFAGAPGGGAAPFGGGAGYGGGAFSGGGGFAAGAGWAAQTIGAAGAMVTSAFSTAEGWRKQLASGASGSDPSTERATRDGTVGAAALPGAADGGAPHEPAEGRGAVLAQAKALTSEGQALKRAADAAGGHGGQVGDGVIPLVRDRYNQRRLSGGSPVTLPPLEKANLTEPEQAARAFAVGSILKDMASVGTVALAGPAPAAASVPATAGVPGGMAELQRTNFPEYVRRLAPTLSPEDRANPFMYSLGQDVPAAVKRQVWSDLQTGAHAPRVLVESMAGANATYTETDGPNGTIRINGDLIGADPSHPGGLGAVAAWGYLEEVGHWADARAHQLMGRPGGDSLGDEGARFALLASAGTQSHDGNFLTDLAIPDGSATGRAMTVDTTVLKAIGAEKLENGSFARENRTEDGVENFGPEGHYQTTYITVANVAERLGFSKADADRIANRVALGSQLPDMLERYDAASQFWAKAAANANDGLIASQGGMVLRPTWTQADDDHLQSVYQGLHGLPRAADANPAWLRGERASTAQYVAERLGAGDWITAGVAIHRYGDLHAHVGPDGRSYHGDVGHGASGLDPHWPDYLYRDESRILNRDLAQPWNRVVQYQGSLAGVVSTGLVANMGNNHRQVAQGAQRAAANYGHDVWQVIYNTALQNSRGQDNWGWRNGGNAKDATEIYFRNAAQAFIRGYHELAGGRGPAPLPMNIMSSTGKYRVSAPETGSLDTVMRRFDGKHGKP